jgi:dGTPase
VARLLHGWRDVPPADIDAVRTAGAPLVTMSDDVLAEHLELKRFLRDNLYRHYRVLRMTTKARRVVQDLFGAFFRDVNLMPTEHCLFALRGEAAHGEAGRARAVADYIAGMTDRYAIREHERIFVPGAPS